MMAEVVVHNVNVSKYGVNPTVSASCPQGYVITGQLLSSLNCNVNNSDGGYMTPAVNTFLPINNPTTLTLNANEHSYSTCSIVGLLFCAKVCN